MAIANVKVEGLQKSFWDESRGEVRAVDGIDFDCQPGEVFRLLGANGAGKTTLVSMICGRTPSSSGRINFKGKDITRLSSAKRVQAGIVYTFQVTSIFGNLSCFENVALSAQRTSPRCGAL